MTERKQGERPPERKERLSEALRENLKRRKAQARGRAATAARPPKAGHARKMDDEGSGR